MVVSARLRPTAASGHALPPLRAEALVGVHPDLCETSCARRPVRDDRMSSPGELADSTATAPQPSTRNEVASALRTACRDDLRRHARWKIYCACTVYFQWRKGRFPG